MTPAIPSATTAPWDLDFIARRIFVGTQLFIGEWSCPGGHTSTSEVARHVELSLLRQGAHRRTIGKSRRVVDPTIATLDAAGDEYRMTSSLAPQRSTSILVRGALADELVPQLGVRFGHVSPDAARLHLRLLRSADPLAIEETAFALLHQVLVDASARPAFDARASSARRVLAEEAQHVIATRFAERLTLEVIADACHSSPFYISRVFRSVIGETIHRHLTRVRLRMALFQLRQSAGRLTELALAVGFSSHSHFTQAFRLEFGCTPTELFSL